MENLFSETALANPDVSGWDMSSVTTARAMFYNAASANPDVSGWDTSNIANLEFTFAIAPMANPDVSSWDTSSVTSLHGTFYQSSNANPDVSGWNTSNVINMNGTFQESGFTGPLDTWDFSSATELNSFLTDVTLSQSHYDNLLLSLGSQVLNNDVYFSGGNNTCLLYTSPSPRDKRQSRMPSSA